MAKLAQEQPAPDGRRKEVGGGRQGGVCQARQKEKDG